MGNGVSRFLEVFHLLVRRFAAAFPRRERHAHRRRRVGARALRHHVGDGLRDLLMGMAGDKFDPRGIDAAVKYIYFTVLVPCDVFILQQKGEVFVRSLHVSSLSLSIKALDGTLHVGAHLVLVQRLEFTVFI